MRVVVFLGPTIPVGNAQALLPAVFRPPASRGDIYAAARSNPWAIALIDGYFHRVPTVLHKEILWAMSQGIHVYGASSMGALRAAELERFGMVGVGRVFEAYRDGILSDDDEVAVVHGPAEAGYLAGSDAMVNIRATLDCASQAGVVDAEVAERLLRIAKDTFYPMRTWKGLLGDAREAALAPAQRERLEAWLPEGRVDQKRLDAIEMFRRIAADREAELAPKQVSFRFNGTFMWDELRNSIDQRPPDDSPDAIQVMEDELLDELRLQGDAYAREHERALMRVLATELALARNERCDPTDTTRVTAALRENRGLSEPGRLTAWLEQEGLTTASFTRLMQDEAVIRRLETRYAAWIPVYLRDVLRLSGRYGELSARAWDKQDRLSRAGFDAPSLADAELSEPELWRWFFRTMATEVPANLDEYAARHGFSDVDRMRRAVLREFLYLRQTQRRPRAAAPQEVRSD